MPGSRKSKVLELTALLWIAQAFAPEAAGAADGKASVKLQSASTTIVQRSDTEWTLEKTGSLHTPTRTVTWEITATEGATVGGRLVIGGQLVVSNTGSGPAPIGNIVVNLQVKSASKQAKGGSKWVTWSSAIADATQGDAATTAKIHAQASSEGKSWFSENAASGPLEFMDAGSNTVFSLVPQVEIAPGASVPLHFKATFDNRVLALPTGLPIRAEVIVSFGNAPASKASTPNVDINGNGMIDGYEHRVRSVPLRTGLTVPEETHGNAVVALSDTLDDITTTGTVTFSNAIFNLGATSGTVQVTYHGGAAGGTITNCANLTGSGGLALQACDTQVIGAHTCTPGTPGCGWENGDVITYRQTTWGDPAGATAALLTSRFFTLYPSELVVGIPGAAGFSMAFGTAGDILAYLPQLGSAGVLTADLLNPTTSSSGSFGGETVALKLNVDFSDAGFTLGSSGLRFGDLRLCGLGLSGIDGLTVRQFLALANHRLGGGSGTHAVGTLDGIASALNASFASGTPSTFAQNRLVWGPCPGSGWEVGDVITYSPGGWDANAAALALLASYYNTVYASTFGVLEVGIPGASGFSAPDGDVGT